MAYTRLEPRVGEKISLVCVGDDCSYASSCGKCFFQQYDCLFMVCNPREREDRKSVHFERVELDGKEVEK